MSAPYDLVVVGGGSAGLTAARFAAKIGARTALVERARLGGDCTHYGCVPSKALLAAAKVVHAAREAKAFGLEVTGQVDLGRVRAHVREAVRAVAEAESAEVLERAGIDVITGPGRFVDGRSLAVGDRIVRAKRFVVATGARAFVPAPLAKVPHQTYETLFELDALPRSLVVVGGGPIGVELAQAYARLGADVQLVAEALLPEEDATARLVVRDVLTHEGVTFHDGTVTSARHENGRVFVTGSFGEVSGDVLLVATGRRPNVGSLALASAGVRFSERGIETDATLATTCPTIFAAGDVRGGTQLTHLAGWEGFHAARNALLPGKAKGTPTVLPRVLFTDPEVARVGLDVDEARRAHGARVRVFEQPMTECDRARADGEVAGFLRLVTLDDETIVGATVVSSRAGETIAELALAIEHGLTIAKLAATVHPYPTWATSVQMLTSEVSVDAFSGSSFGAVAKALGRLVRR